VPPLFLYPLEPSIKQKRFVECGVWCVVCGVWCVVCGVWCVVCGVWCVVCGVWCDVCGVVWCVVFVWCVVCGVERGPSGIESGIWNLHQYLLYIMND
jgi:hypothetical protein